ncbi:class I SAM-dependent methyltransferase [Saccharopolyspora erythraea]|uniref:class I SAM-dependent DNA methyltransferase n=1 Tax=Saccharopolyspora erythraea TaxID=1836 RepID=UPI001BA93DF7|nr:class I SAM-dependent methyltransferase [Saccharopolyspora erythraea]QUH04731.1 class I SAM-dependent methyltransferase [Saccharopolyspora erythraea]
MSRRVQDQEQRAGVQAASSNFLTDNPALYEQQFPDPEHVAARFVDDVVRRFGGPDAGSLLDIGCGTGRDARYWSLGGRDVAGLDSSERMVEYARRQCPGGEFVVADMRSFALARRFDVITCLDSALLYCHTNEELEGFLRLCHAHLVEGGLLVAEMRNGAFFLGNTELLDGVRERTVEWEGVGYRSRTTLWIDHAAQLLRRRRIWDWPGCPEPLDQRSAWRLLFPLELRSYLERAGFEVLAVFDEPGPRTDAPWHAEAPLSEALAGDRLHFVARARGGGGVV